MEEGLTFKIGALDPDHVRFGGILSRVRWDLPIHIPNLKLLASPISNLDIGVLKFKNSTLDPD